MRTIVKLYSMEKGEIQKFLNEFLNGNFSLKNELNWAHEYDNPVEVADIIGSFIDNNDKFNINMWVSLDQGVFINVTDNNVDDIIKYLYERFPY